MPNKKRKGKGGDSRTAQQAGHPGRTAQEQKQQQKQQQEQEQQEQQQEQQPEDAAEEGKLAEAAGGAAAPSPPKEGAGAPPGDAERRKKAGKVDVDGSGINLADDLMKADEEEEDEEEEEEEKGRGNADESIVSLGIELCENFLEGLPRDGAKKLRMGYGDRQTCPALGVKPESLREASKERLMERILRMRGVDIVEVMRQLWDREHRDYQYMVLEMLTTTIIPLSREMGFEEVFKFLEYCILTKSGKDTVDHLAKYHLNALAYLEPPETKPVMDAWVEQDQHPWLQRAALLHQVCLGKYCDFERVASYCSKFTHMAQDTEGFEEKWSAVHMALTSFGDTGHPTDGERGQDKPPTAKDQLITFLDEQLKTKPSEGMKKRLEDLKKDIVEKRRTFLKSKIR